MRVAWVVDGELDQLSGGYLYDRIVVDYLRSQDVQVEVLSLPVAPYGRRLATGAPPWVLQTLKDGAFDIVVEDELSHPALIGVNRRLARENPALRRVALVHHLRSSEPRPWPANLLVRQIERAYLATAEAFLFNSQTTRRVVHALCGDRRPSVVALPGADRLGPALPRSRVEPRASEAGPLRVLFVGNLIPRKGLLTLLEALALLPRGTATLTVAGSEVDPHLGARATSAVRRFRLTAEVAFVGPLDRASLARTMSNHHVLAIPSSYEGYGMAYLEGLGHGLPAIAGTDGGAREFIRDDQNGYLVPAGDPAGLAARLLGLAGDRKNLLRLSLGALRTFREHPSWTDTGICIHRFLQDLNVGSPSATP